MVIITDIPGLKIPVTLSKSTRYKVMPTSIDTAVPILDIRPGPTEFDILQDIKNGLRPENGGEKRLPTLLLYDEAGLRLFEKITYLEEYYLTNAEIEVLEAYADRIAHHIQPGSIVVELGSGNLRKVNILLQAIDRAGKSVEYYAVDLSLPELKRTFSEIPTAGYKHVKCFGLYGTYDHALEWLKSEAVRDKPKLILWLGSSLGNFRRAEVAPFLSGFREAIQPGDTMLIGIDSCKQSDRVYHAYNDKEGVTHQFILNGLKHANRIMDKAVFNLEDWEAIGEYDVENGRHHAFVSPIKDVVVDGVPIYQGERVRIEESYKFSRQEILDLWEGASMAENSVFTNARGDYGLYLVSKPVVFFPSNPKEYAARPVPSISDWKQLWAAWDAVSRNMIPEKEMKSKPIKLRNECIFYLGHIPTFLDIHICRATGFDATEPAYFHQIFERGIDPDVDHPEICHAHSEVPDHWPALEKIIKYQQDLRSKVEGLYTSHTPSKNPRVARALWLGFEHEAMHLETLLYMLVQSENAVAPPGGTTPDFEVLARKSQTTAIENEWFNVPESTVFFGLKDGDDDSVEHFFGWDNERPARSVIVPAFEAKGRPITNGEYARYLNKTGNTSIPASWCEFPNSFHKGNAGGKRDSVLNGTNGSTNGSITPSRDLSEAKYVRTVYGSVPLKYALDWPVVASYDELAGCAQWMGGRIPTLEEARSIYNFVDRSKTEDLEQAIGKTIPAVNGHLINDGVEETPPSRPLTNGFSNAVSDPLDPLSLFIELKEANVGFKHWHPISVVEKGDQLCGQSDLGGVWEWTSTVLVKQEGFVPMELYPGYTADFFDGKHNITLGGSWATHPRLAGRKTFINWYQRNYPYVWAGARLVRDFEQSNGSA